MKFTQKLYPKNVRSNGRDPSGIRRERLEYRIPMLEL